MKNAFKKEKSRLLACSFNYNKDSATARVSTVAAETTTITAATTAPATNTTARKTT